jgi:hypothetical protein
MALTFPTSPTNGQIFTDTITGNRYVYDSSKSIWKFSSNSVGMSVSSTPPANVAAGAMWFNREIGRTFVYYDDGDSVQWIETVPAGTIDTNTIAGYVNPIFAATNNAYTVANVGFSVTNAAFGIANTHFANTPNASFSSSFNVPNGSVSIGTNAFPVGKFQVVTANGEISRFTATGNSGGYVVSYFDNSTPWYLGSAKAAIAGNINDLYLGSGTGTTNNLLLGVGGAEKARIDTNGLTITGNVGVGVSPTSKLFEIRKDQNLDTSLWITNNNQIAPGTNNSIIFGGYRDVDTVYQVAKISAIHGTGSSANANHSGSLAFFTQQATGGSNPELPIERMRINSSGYVTKPYQPFARVALRGVTSYVVSSGQIIVFNTADENVGSCFNTSTGRFTCPVAGVYVCMSAIELSVPSNSGWSINYSLYKNASNIAGVYEGTPATSYWLGKCYGMVTCAANDILDFRLLTNTSVTNESLPGDSRNYAMFYLLG